MDCNIDYLYVIRGQMKAEIALLEAIAKKCPTPQTDADLITCREKLSQLQTTLAMKIALESDY